MARWLYIFFVIGLIMPIKADPVPEESSKVISQDGRCTPKNGDGNVQCDPGSDDFCCSAFGYCGGTTEHCDCDDCINYNTDKTREWCQLMLQFYSLFLMSTVSL